MYDGMPFQGMIWYTTVTVACIVCWVILLAVCLNTLLTTDEFVDLLVSVGANVEQRMLGTSYGGGEKEIPQIARAPQIGTLLNFGLRFHMAVLMACLYS